MRQFSSFTRSVLALGVCSSAVAVAACSGHGSDSPGPSNVAANFDLAYVKAAAKSVRYVYLTSDDLPNPWDTLPSYFDSLLGALD